MTVSTLLIRGPDALLMLLVDYLTVQVGSHKIDASAQLFQGVAVLE